MLQHEPTPEVLHPPFTSNYASALTSQETEGMTPQELAQAIVAVEERQKTSLQAGADSPVIQQVIEKSGLAITPDSLLAEVHRQRAQSHQNSAMTPHLTQNLSVRLLIAGLIFASIVALFLLATNVVFINRFSVANEALAKYDALANQKTSALNALQRLQSWNYPGAQNIGNNNTGQTASATMTTKDAYGQVWKHYAGQTGFTTSLPSTTFLRATGPKAGLDAAISISDGSGSSTVDGQTINYNTTSSSAADTQITTFTWHAPQYTVITTLTHNVNRPETAINVVATTP